MNNTDLYPPVFKLLRIIGQCFAVDRGTSLIHTCSWTPNSRSQNFASRN